MPSARNISTLRSTGLKRGWYSKKEIIDVNFNNSINDNKGDFGTMPLRATEKFFPCCG